jgi:tetratricopeptide (TPR) repeat protein
MPGSRDDDRRGGSGAPRGPRRPIKGKRRTFDTDSAPNARERARQDRPKDDDERVDRTDERWIDEGPVRRAAGEAVARGAAKRAPRPSGGRRPTGDARRRAGDGRPSVRSSGRNDKRRTERAAKRAESALEIDRQRLDRQLGPAKAARTISRLGEAADAFAEDRFEEARRLLKPLAETVPDEPAIRELYGVTLYRLGRWRLAVTELEEFARRTGSAEQHPVLADCHRALGHHRRVAELWEELGAASPDAATVAEGRIVHAGSLADQGKVAEAIAVLEQGSLGSKKLKHHHLRMRYALGDLYDRAGEHQAARRQFEAVAAADPAFFDVSDRLRQL